MCIYIYIQYSVYNRNFDKAKIDNRLRGRLPVIYNRFSGFLVTVYLLVPGYG
jgi:hypothetical protein